MLNVRRWWIAPGCHPRNISSQRPERRRLWTTPHNALRRRKALS